MNLIFYKYQGTGNDFVMIDNRAKTFPKKKTDIISQLCDRHFGIGADGLILLENDTNTDFKMVYFNADGNESTMCGNGGRCIVAFAKQLNLINNKTTFNAIDGVHYAEINNNIISLQMINVDEVMQENNFSHLNTGSPHHVQMVENIDTFPVVNFGRKIRNSYGDAGCNVNFVEQFSNEKFKVRTYERGVEDETLACGTGVTATAIAMHNSKKTDKNNIVLEVLGGILEVSFTFENSSYKNIFLKGPASYVFKGEISI